MTVFSAACKAAGQKKKTAHREEYQHPPMSPRDREMNRHPPLTRLSPRDPEEVQKARLRGTCERLSF